MSCLATFFGRDRAANECPLCQLLASTVTQESQEISELVSRWKDIKSEIKEADLTWFDWATDRRTISNRRKEM
jgi:hypothetical protein